MKNFIIALVLTFGLIAGGSDGKYFPIPNIAGVTALLMLVATTKSIRGE